MANSASGMSPNSTGYLCVPHCTYRNVIHASNFACALSRSPTICSIQLVIQLSRGASEALLLQQEVTVLMTEMYESGLHCGQFPTQGGCCS